MSFPRYPKYKDSGVQWLGEVPAHWNIVQMKRISTIRYGIGEPPKYQVDGTPLLRATNVHAGKLFADGLVFVDPKDIPAQRIVWLTPGDIIVVRSGAYTGDSAIIPDSFGPCIAGFDMVLRCHLAQSEFIQFTLLSSYLKEGQLDIAKMRAAQPHLNAEELGSCFVVLPLPNEQSLIVSFIKAEIAKIDGLIQEQERLIELLKEKRQAVISHAVTKGLNPHAPMKPSGIEWLGDVPAHWEVKRIKNLAILISKGTTPTTVGAGFTEVGIRFLKAENIADSKVSEEPIFYISEDSHRVLSRSSLQKDDVLVVIAGATTGKSAVMPCDLLPANTNQAVSFVRLRNVNFAQYVALWLGTNAVRELIFLNSIQSAQPNLSMEDLGNIPIPLPPVSELLNITALLHREISKLDVLTAEAQRAIDLLQERRTALISAAVTGKIDVRGWVAKEAA